MVEPKNRGSFVARIWLEGDSVSNLEWRGHVQHVHSGEECYFRNLSAMREFLERISGVPMPINDSPMNDNNEEI